MQWYGDEENCGERKKNEMLLCTLMLNNIRQVLEVRIRKCDEEGGSPKIYVQM